MLLKLRDRVICDCVSLLLGQPFLQAAYDLAGPPKCEGDCVPKHFSSCHAS